MSSIPKNLSSSLEVVKLGGVHNLQGELLGELPQSICHLPNLKTLVLQSNGQLYGDLPSVRWNSSATLEWLDLSGILFSGKIPDSIRNLIALRGLHLSYCGFIGSLPKEIFDYMTQIEEIDLEGNMLIGSLPSFPREMKHLTKLVLADNSFTGSITPSWLFSLSSLKYLELGSNQLYGPLPIELSSLVYLQTLQLSSNNFIGHVDLNIFSNMKQLDFLDLSHIRLSLITKNNSTLPETISMLLLRSCSITTLEFLRSLSSYDALDLSMNNIHEVPSWLWPKWENVDYLNLSYNSIIHTKEIVLPKVFTLDLRSNMFHGPFPQVPTVQYLLISNNNFSGVIPPSIICRLIGLEILGISNNNFTGSIPSCIGNMTYLSVLDMRMNKLEGAIPTDISSRSLKTLNLYGNHLRGNIPSSLAKCTKLTVLDLGNNYLNGSFPSWLGNLQKLRVLCLRSNNFHGKLSFSTTSFSRLQILDLSHNRFIGTLSPNLFKSFTGMMEIDEISESPSYIESDQASHYEDSIVVVNKGVEVELVKILTTWDTIDLSSNNFEGKIPSSVVGLISMRQLNFSNNRFESEIPISFGKLSVLESLDLSSNQLIGKIPTQLATLHFLSKLNLSHNRLTGRIPSTTQFQTFGNDSYIDNNGLCGFPVSENCEGDSPDLSHSPEEDDDSGFIDGFSWRSVVIGYGVGVVSGLGIGCLMMVTRKPKWLISIVEEEGYRMVMKRDRKKISKRIGRKN